MICPLMYAQVILLKSEPMHVTKKKSTGTNLIPLIISRESDVCNNDLWVNRKEITFVVVFWGCIYLSLFYFLPTLHPLLHNVLNSDNIFRWKNFTVKEVIIRLWISLHYYLCSRFGAFLQNSQGLFFYFPGIYIFCLYSDKHEGFSSSGSFLS